MSALHSIFCMRNLLLMLIFLWEAYPGELQGVGLLRERASKGMGRFLPTQWQLIDETRAPSLRKLLHSVQTKFPGDSSLHFDENDLGWRMSQGFYSALGISSSREGFTPSSRFWEGSLLEGFGLRPKSPWKAHGYVPLDRFYAQGQWNLNNTGQEARGQLGTMGVDIGIASVWEQFGGADTLVIALVDAGLNLYHPEMKDRIWRNAAEVSGISGVDDDGNGFVDDSIGWDFVEGDADPFDYDGHGSTVGGIMIAEQDNAMGMAGILEQGRVMPIRVLSSAGYGDQDDVAAGIRYAVRNGAHVINLSLGGESENQRIVDAFDEARQAGVFIVISSGNEGRDLDDSGIFPFGSGLSNVISVASIDNRGALSSFSNYGSETVDIAAPGQFVLTCGIPTRKKLLQEGFEGDAPPWVMQRQGDFAVTTENPLEESRSIAWMASRNSYLAMAEYLDLMGERGTTLSFKAEFAPGGSTDVLVVEGNRKGSTVWEEIGIIPYTDSVEVLTFTLQEFENSAIKVRFRLVSRFSSIGRIFRLDGLEFSAYEPKPETFDIYVETSGTSLSAPHVSAYVGLLRLACDRMGVALTRERILKGAVALSSLEGKLKTGARLDVAKGLDFYLQTLPRLAIQDTNVKWVEGQTVRYAVTLQGAAETDFRFSLLPDSAKFSLDTLALMSTWEQATKGTYALRIAARGNITLRRHLGFSVGAKLLPTVALKTEGSGITIHKGRGYRPGYHDAARDFWLDPMGRRLPLPVNP